jgi:hypothetical protein
VRRKAELAEQAAKHAMELVEEAAKHEAELSEEAAKVEDHIAAWVSELKRENADLTMALIDAEDDCVKKSMASEDAEHANATLSASLEEAKCDHVTMLGGGKKLHDKKSRMGAIGSVLMNTLVVIMKHTQPITCLRTVVDCLFSSALFGVEVTKVVLAEVYKKFIFNEHQNTFASWKVLKAIDLSLVGGLNYNGIKTLRSFENLDKYQRGISPSRLSIQRAFLELFNLGQELFPFHWKESDLGEVYQNDYEKFIRYIIKSFGLEDIAQRDSIEVLITLDGAELCDGLCHVTAGLKRTDARAVDPRDGKPLSCFNEGMGRIFSTQSRNYCFAMKSLLGKDSKEAYREFSYFSRSLRD